MEWNEVIIDTTQEAKEAVANILNEFGANGVVIDEPIAFSEKELRFGEIYELEKKHESKNGVIIKAYFLDDENWESLNEKIIARINELATYQIDIGAWSISVKRVKQSDWENEWKKYFKPLRATERFTIVPTWENYQKESDDEMLIFMDPGMAFGTGSHATTKLSLEALQKVIRQNDTVVDVGSGSGILSIAACYLKAGRVYSFDLDPVAVSSTKRNRDLNGFTKQIIVQKNDLLKGVQFAEPVDVIVANILAHIILNLIVDANRVLKTNGYFIVSGIIQKEAETVKKRLKEHGFAIVETLREGHWTTMIAQKRDSR